MQRYAITGGTPGTQMQAWAAAGVEWVQLREPSLSRGELLVHAQTLARLCRDLESRTQLVVNGLSAIDALRQGAHGVHLRGGATAEAVAEARAAGARVSVSCHTLDEVRSACSGGADAVLWAPVFGKTVDGRAVAPGSGLEPLRNACRAAEGTPVFALGGVTVENACDCVAAGAAGVAGIRLFASEGWRGLIPDSEARTARS